jgi:hypothetical protein
LGVARVIWNRSRNPTNYVSEQLGIERWQLREAIHKIKSGADMSAEDAVIVYDDGTVTNSADEPVGNIYDEI